MDKGMKAAKPAICLYGACVDAVSLSWDDPGDMSITDYQVLRRDKGLHAVGVLLADVDDTGSASTAYVDEDVMLGARYVYRIKARNAAGLSERSEWFDVDMPAAPTPANSPATGAPTISGTAQVGETLTADTTGEIEDKHFWLVVHDGLAFGSGWHHDESGS